MRLRSALPLHTLAVLLSALAALVCVPRLTAEGPGLRPDVPRALEGGGTAGFAAVPVRGFEVPDTALLAAEDAARSAAGEPYRFAVPRSVYLTPDTAGSWESLGEGRLRWRLRVRSEGAVSLNFGFTRFAVPEEGRLLLYTADGLHAAGPYGAADVRPHGELWTPILPGGDVVLEAVVPEARRGELTLELGWVNLGYRPPWAGAPVERDSGACNVDVACPEGDAYRDIIRSVARITVRGSVDCTGTMLNNTAGDFRPLFLTADHCGVTLGSAPSVVFYWLFESSACRRGAASGGPGDGSPALHHSGARLLARYGLTDFALLEPEEEPPRGARVFWAGWDRGSGNPSRGVAIHHPSGEEKRISFENDALRTTSYGGDSGPGDGTHLRVEDWDVGTTEGGSSGSPLFDAAKRVVGQLHGGRAACGNDEADWYGRLSRSWAGGGTPSSRLRDWLDPAGSGVLQLGGGQPPQGGDLPNAPGSLAAEALSATEVRLTWQDTSSGEIGFRIELRKGGGGFQAAGSVGENVTSTVVIGLVPDTQYTFRVQARSEAGGSPYSNPATARTLPAAPAPPPAGFAARPVSASEVLLTWKAPQPAAGDGHVELSVRPVARLPVTPSGPLRWIEDGFYDVARVPAEAGRFTLTGLSPSTLYDFRLRAEGGAGPPGEAAEASAATREAGGPEPCRAPAGELCLLGGRFRVQAVWNDFRGGEQGLAGARVGAGAPLDQAGADHTGLLWFFQPSNVELVVRMESGEKGDDTFALTYGGLSDVEYWLVVTDTESGARSVFRNPPREICGRRETLAFPASDASGLGALPPRSGIPRSGICGAGSDRLCLLDRFEVRVNWRDRDGERSAAGALTPAAGAGPLQTGTFWFQDRESLDLAVKMVDGSEVNGSYWVYWGGLSDLEYEVTVTDTLTGAARTYRNPPGSLCGGSDTSGLDGLLLP